MGISIRQDEGSLYAGSGAIIGKAAAGELYFDTNDDNTVKMGV